MPKGLRLTDTQLIMLSKAAVRSDGAAIVAPRMNTAAAAKLAASLVARKFMRELRAKPGMPVWRKGEDGRAISLVITRAGRDAIGVDDERAGLDVAADKLPPSGKGSLQKIEDQAHKRFANLPTPMATQDVELPMRSAQPRPGSKQALVIGMLAQDGGATLEAIVTATGWLPHTARAVLTGLRKRGFAIERQRPQGADVSVYRIAPYALMAA